MTQELIIGHDVEVSGDWFGLPATTDVNDNKIKIQNDFDDGFIGYCHRVSLPQDSGGVTWKLPTRNNTDVQTGPSLTEPPQNPCYCYEDLVLTLTKGLWLISVALNAHTKSGSSTSSGYGLYDYYLKDIDTGECMAMGSTVMYKPVNASDTKDYDKRVQRNMQNFTLLFNLEKNTSFQLLCGGCKMFPNSSDVIEPTVTWVDIWARRIK